MSVSLWSHAAAAFVMMKELPPWVPGRTEKFHQIVLRDDGSAQVANVVNQKAVNVSNFRHTHTGGAWFDLDALFSLNDTYLEPQTPGMLKEGRGERVLFILHSGTASKFISADANLLPNALIHLRQQIKMAVKHHGYMSISLMAPTTESWSASVPFLGEAVLKEFAEVSQALDAPYDLVPFTQDRWTLLLKTLGRHPEAVFVKNDKGDLLRIEFFQ